MTITETTETKTKVKPEKRIPLVELFGPTIQGEGAVIGQQTYFLRFGLCDFKCTMCDSMNAVDPKQVKENADWLTQDEIFDQLQSFKLEGSTNWVTFSGGNPCIHDLGKLCRLLRNTGWRIAVETQGTDAPDWLEYANVVTCSPKGPGMGEKCDLEVLDNFMSHVNDKHVNVKIVLFDERDLEFAKMIAERYLLVKEMAIPFYLSLGNPWPPGLDSPDPLPKKSPNSVADTELVERLVTLYRRMFDCIKQDPLLSKMRFLPQWHVFVWGNEKGR